MVQLNDTVFDDQALRNQNNAESGDFHVQDRGPGKTRYRLRTFFLCLYLLRVQIFGFALLWPLSGWAFQSPMFRGLRDIQTLQLLQIEVVVAIFIAFLVCTTNLVLLYGRERVEWDKRTPDQGDEEHTSALVPKGWITWGTPLIGAVIGVLFLRNVVMDWTTEKFVWSAALPGTLLFTASVWWLMLRRAFIRSIALPLVLTELDVLMQQNQKGMRRIALQGLSFLLRSVQLLQQYAHRLPRALAALLGPGYGRGDRIFVGHIVALLLFVYFLLVFYSIARDIPVVQYPRFFGTRPSETSGSTLLLALCGVQFVVGLLTLLTFYFDRYRIPIFAVTVLLVTVSSLLHNPDSTFHAQPVTKEQKANLLTPKEVLAKSPPRIIVVAAAGGGIQASGWTARVLTGLTDELGENFTKHLRVISGVSGGSVGSVFYLGSYADVWSDKPWKMEEVMKAATSSFLEDVAWGLVYPDLHRLVVPIPFWGEMDRGLALEKAFARTAKKSHSGTILDLAPKVAEGLPVIILNATLTNQALPVVFTNSRFPDPNAPEKHKRRIRSFWHDYRFDTYLETAMRVSASFPYISPASRPQPLPGVDAFVDGGFFDNSGLYSLMAWLEEASEGRRSSRRRDVLIVMIDPFPEPDKRPDRRVERQWYHQLVLPLTTVIGVRETAQATRTQYEFPLLAQSLASAFNITSLSFRYTPSPRCGLDSPPLSWRLTKLERECLDEAWIADDVEKSRSLVKTWLDAKPASQ